MESDLIMYGVLDAKEWLAEVIDTAPAEWKGMVRHYLMAVAEVNMAMSEELQDMGKSHRATQAANRHDFLMDNLGEELEEVA